MRVYTYYAPIGGRKDHAQEKKRNGAVHFHGVKTQSAFNALAR